VPAEARRCKRRGGSRRQSLPALLPTGEQDYLVFAMFHGKLHTADGVRYERAPAALVAPAPHRNRNPKRIDESHGAYRT
jgi:hypothetical protein